MRIVTRPERQASLTLGPSGESRSQGLTPDASRACQQPELQKRWSVRSLAREVGLPRSTMHEMLVASGLQPHRLRTFRPNPYFEAKLLDVVSLYLNPA